MNPLLLFYLLGLFDEDDNSDNDDNCNISLFDLSTKDIIKDVLIGFISGISIVVIADLIARWVVYH